MSSKGLQPKYNLQSFICFLKQKTVLGSRECKLIQKEREVKKEKKMANISEYSVT